MTTPAQTGVTGHFARCFAPVTLSRAMFVVEHGGGLDFNSKPVTLLHMSKTQARKLEALRRDKADAEYKAKLARLAVLKDKVLQLGYEAANRVADGVEAWTLNPELVDGRKIETWRDKDAKWYITIYKEGEL